MTGRAKWSVTVDGEVTELSYYERALATGAFARHMLKLRAAFNAPPPGGQ